MADILDHPALFVHYFLQRERCQKFTVIFPHEMDLLGLYLETGLNLTGIEQQGGRLTVNEMSKAIDLYYVSKEAGVTVSKPKPKLRSYMSAMIFAVEARSFPGWLTVSIDLLRAANYDEQKVVERALKKLRSNVQLNWQAPSHVCSVSIIPAETRSAIVIFYLYPASIEGGRRTVTDQLISNAFEEDDRPRCIVVGRNIDRWDAAYSFIVVAENERE